MVSLIHWAHSDTEGVMLKQSLQAHPLACLTKHAPQHALLLCAYIMAERRETTVPISNMVST